MSFPEALIVFEEMLLEVELVARKILSEPVPEVTIVLFKIILSLITLHLCCSKNG